MTDNGVTIGLREIYDSLQEVVAGLSRLEGRITRLEERITTADEADERSREALEVAKAALKLAEQLQSNQTWMWRTVVGGLVTGAIGLLFLFARGGI